MAAATVQKIRPAINGLSHRTRHQMFDIGGFIQYPFHLFFKGKVRHLNENKLRDVQEYPIQNMVYRTFQSSESELVSKLVQNIRKKKVK